MNFFVRPHTRLRLLAIVGETFFCLLLFTNATLLTNLLLVEGYPCAAITALRNTPIALETQTKHKAWQTEVRAYQLGPLTPCLKM